MHALRRRRNWILGCPDADVCGNRSTDAKIISSLTVKGNRGSLVQVCQKSPPFLGLYRYMRHTVLLMYNVGRILIVIFHLMAYYIFSAHGTFITWSDPESLCKCCSKKKQFPGKSWAAAEKWEYRPPPGYTTQPRATMPNQQPQADATANDRVSLFFLFFTCVGGHTGWL